VKAGNNHQEAVHRHKQRKVKQPWQARSGGSTGLGIIVAIQIA